MFGPFRKKKQRVPGPDAIADPPAPGEPKPRGLLPTRVSDTELVLCKAGPVVRNTYEIRLALYRASASGKKLVLEVAPDARVDEALVEQIESRGGELRRGEVRHHAVYVGCLYPDGAEDGWTLGDESALATLRASLKSTWLRERLQVGSLVPLRDLIQFGNELWEESTDLQNVDGENVKDALLALMVAAIQSEGGLFVQ
jgi:hypothetical protein